MLRGLYTAANGMITESQRTDVIANNVANVNTTGYKQDQAAVKEFEELLLRRIQDGKDAPEIGSLGRGSLVDEIMTINHQGSITQTGGSYDLAIQGEGYFMIETPQGVRYTRDGSFARSAQGELVNNQGFRVLGANGRPIQLPEGETVTVVGDGVVYVDEVEAAQMGFVNFEDPRALLKQGDNLYFAQDGQTPVAAGGTILQGVLENSNVNTVSEMVNLINAYRAYEANAKAVTSQDSLLEKAVNEVGRSN